jgi:hypothetical protein
MHKYLTILLFLSSFAAKSQTVLIPYREGKLWGVCDTLGNIVVKPAYDRVEIIDKFAPGYFRTLKKGRYGVVNSKVEIIKPVFNKINCWWNSYFEADSSSSKQFFNLNGDPLFPGNYNSMWTQTSIERKDYDANNSRRQKPLFLFFIGFDTNYRTGLFCYNIEKPEDSKLLTEGKKNYEIDIVVRYINYYSSVFEVAGKYILVSYNFKKKKLIVLKFKTEKELKKAEQKIIDKNEISKKEEPVFKSLFYKKYELGRYKYIISNDTLFREHNIFKRSNDWSYGGINITHKTPLGNFNSKNYKLTIRRMDYNTGLVNGGTYFGKEVDSTLYIDYVLYKNDMEQGYIWGDKVIPMVYDSLFHLQNDLFQCFIYGSKDEDGNTKYGIMQTDGTITIPAAYDEINYKERKWWGLGQTLWVTRKDGKYGLLNPAKNKIVLEAIYDTIIKEPFSHILLKKNDLYGVYNPQSLFNEDNKIFLEPFTPFKIFNIIHLPRTDDDSKNWFLLLELRNENKEIIGYANKNGFKYFKD